MKKAKHKRANRERWDKAWNLVQFWYAEMAKEGAIRYTVSGDEVTIAVPQENYGERDSLALAKQERPQNWRVKLDKAGVEIITADGKERRYILPQQAERGFWGVSTRPLIVQSRRKVVRGGVVYEEVRDVAVPLEPRIKYARKVMQHVARLSIDAHKVLEMRAATWDFPAIAANLSCAEPTARQYFSEGLGIVMCYQEFCKPGHTGGRYVDD